jgi:hypothetical protein
MANLLLDRTFDPQGLICSLLSQAMSSSSVPNRGCYNGAVDDMQVSSFATTNFLNLGVHPTDIEVHGLATVFDPNTIPDVSFAAAPFGVGPFLVARLLRSGISLVDDVTTTTTRPHPPRPARLAVCRGRSRRSIPTRRTWARPQTRTSSIG